MSHMTMQYLVEARQTELQAEARANRLAAQAMAAKSRRTEGMTQQVPSAHRTLRRVAMAAVALLLALGLIAAPSLAGGSAPAAHQAAAGGHDTQRLPGNVYER